MIKYTSTHQVFIKTYIKKNKCFSNYIPSHIIPNILKAEETDIVTDEIANNKDFENLILK